MKVIIINIPSRQSAQLLKFEWLALMRIWDSLTEMSDNQIKNIKWNKKRLVMTCLEAELL